MGLANLRPEGPVPAIVSVCWSAAPGSMMMLWPLLNQAVVDGLAPGNTASTPFMASDVDPTLAVADSEDWGARSSTRWAVMGARVAGLAWEPQHGLRSSSDQPLGPHTLRPPCPSR